MIIHPGNVVRDIRLFGWDTWDSSKNVVKAKVFGHMLEIGHDIVAHYKSDFFYEALKINETLDLGNNKEQRYLFSFDDCGVWLWTEEQYTSDYFTPIRKHNVLLTVYRCDEDSGGRCAYSLKVENVTVAK